MYYLVFQAKFNSPFRLFLYLIIIRGLNIKIIKYELFEISLKKEKKT